MNLDQQIQTLIDNAPQDGSTPKIVEAIAPALKLLAEQLQHPQYFVWQTLDENWVMTTLSNRNEPNLEKRVVYAFPTLKDATSSTAEANLVAVPVPVVHILFQMVALAPLESLLFFETPGDLAAATEVKREDVQKLIGTYLQEYQSSPEGQSNKFPPNLA